MVGAAILQDSTVATQQHKQSRAAASLFPDFLNPIQFRSFGTSRYLDLLLALQQPPSFSHNPQRTTHKKGRKASGFALLLTNSASWMNKL